MSLFLMSLIICRNLTNIFIHSKMNSLMCFLVFFNLISALIGKAQKSFSQKGFFGLIVLFTCVVLLTTTNFSEMNSTLSLQKSISRAIALQNNSTQRNVLEGGIDLIVLEKVSSYADIPKPVAIMKSEIVNSLYSFLSTSQPQSFSNISTLNFFSSSSGVIALKTENISYAEYSFQTKAIQNLISIELGAENKLLFKIPNGYLVSVTK
jgi:hypothetical protein